MLRAKQPLKSLSELEHLVMDVLWKRSASTAEDVREALAQRHPMKDSTARTILTRLEEKGYVKHHVEGRMNVYRVSEPPRNLAVTAVQQIIDRLCGGSVEQLIVENGRSRDLDEQELRHLARFSRKNCVSVAAGRGTMSIDLVPQLLSAAIRTSGLGLARLCGLAAVSYPIFSRSARDVDSRPRRYARSNSFGNAGSSGPVQSASNSARCHRASDSGASDGIYKNFRSGRVTP